MPKKEISKFVSSSDYWDGDEFASRIWDFTKIDIQTLGRHLDRHINSREPFTLWGKRRQNEKLALDTDKQRLLLGKINALREISADFCSLQADAIFSQEYIDHLVHDRKRIAEQHFERVIEEHRNDLVKLKVDRTIDKARITAANLGFAKLRAEVRQINAHAESTEVASKKDMQITSLIEKFVDTFDASELPPVYSLFFATTLLNADTNKLSELEIRELIKESVVEKVKADAKLMSANADGARADVDLKLIKNQDMRKKTGL